MKRREFIAGLGAAAAWPLMARGQQCGFADDSLVELSLLPALSRLGWDNGRNMQVVQRFAAGDIDRLAILVKELVASQPDVIIAVGTPAARALQRETRTIPIVFVVVSDPVGAGLVSSLSRPGGNITGLSIAEGTFGGKLLTLLNGIAPKMRRAAAMFNPDTAPGRGLYHLRSFQAAARSLDIEPIVAEVRSDADIENVVASLGPDQGGVAGLPDVFVTAHHRTIIELSIRHKVPVIYDNSDFARDGGLLQYGVNFADQYRRAASYVDQILRGTVPSDLPVELPIRYTFIINLKTANALGLTIPPNLLALADEVIE
jgi:putative tryptophan/tyrosine transport system substrate-binding protein